MNKRNKNDKVLFKIGNLTLTGQVISVLSLQTWIKDDKGNPMKADSFSYDINTIVGSSIVEEKNILIS